ncbi:MAG TPA: hypothetical protein VMI72_16865 [Roseiarcus sp.]|nr:hypothetical protein [Roseiarcus sp.]
MIDLERHDALVRAFPASELGRRLLRRAAASIGVVDLRHTFALHSRATMRLARRLGLLSELRRRYGQAERTEDASSLVFANAGVGPIPPSLMTANGSFDIASSAPPTNGSPLPASTTRPQADPARESTTAMLYRVKRSKAAHDGGKPPVSPMAGGGSAPGMQSSGEPLATGWARAEGTRSPGVLSPEPVAPQWTQAGGTAPAAPGASPDGLLGAMAGPNKQSQGSLSSQARPLVLARREVLVSQTIREDARPAPMKAVSAALPLLHGAARPSTQPSPVSPSAPEPRRDQLQSSVESGFTRRPARAADHAISTDPRQTVYATPNASASTPNDRAAQSPALVAAEIGAAPPSGASAVIVWRKAHHERESRDVMSPAMVGGSMSVDGGQTLSVAGVKADPGERAAPLATPLADVGLADVTHIARQVSRAIARQLRIDRERRGRTR